MQSCSLAQATHPFKTVFKNTLGTFTNLLQDSSVNFILSSILDAAYLTVSKLIPFDLGIGAFLTLIISHIYNVINLFINFYLHLYHLIQN